MNCKLRSSFRRPSAAAQGWRRSEPAQPAGKPPSHRSPHHGRGSHDRHAIQFRPRASYEHQADHQLASDTKPPACAQTHPVAAVTSCPGTVPPLRAIPAWPASVERTHGRVGLAGPGDGPGRRPDRGGCARAPRVHARPGLQPQEPRPAALMHAYIAVSLTTGLRTERSGNSGVITWSPGPMANGCGRRSLERHRPGVHHQHRHKPCRRPRPAHVQEPLQSRGHPGELDPRELWHSFVSLMSDRGMTTAEIARLAGHRSTRTTETVYRHEPGL
jgi:hypothetical protein